MDSPTTQTGHIFISYEHKDQPYTRKLRDSLRQRGFEVWMDEHLESGDRWLRTIEQAVRDSAAVVVVMTPEARDSEWVEAEILRDAALAASGLLVPTIGGPSVHPPQPEGVYAFTQHNRPWPTATGSGRYRRGM